MVELKDIYSEMILDLYKNPVNFGTLAQPDLRLAGGNPLCGDEVSFDVQFDPATGKVAEILFNGHGCAISRAAECLVTELVKGKSPAEITRLGPEDLFNVLGKIIETRIKCALLGLHVLKQGMQAYTNDPEHTKVLTGIKI